MKVFLKIILISFFIFFQIGKSAENYFDNELFAISSKIGFNLNQHKTKFDSYQGLIFCGLFENSSNFNNDFNFGFEKLITSKSFITFNVKYFSQNTDFKTDMNNFARDLTTNNVVNVTSESKINLQYSQLDFSPEFKYTLIQNLYNGPFRLIGGLNFGIPFSAKFYQSEIIKTPSNAVFIDQYGNKVQEKLIQENDLKSLSSFQYGIKVGCDNLLKLSNNLFFTQELYLNYYLSNFLSDVNWKLMNFGISIGLRYSINENKKSEIVLPKETLKPLPDKEIAKVFKRDSVKILPQKELKISNLKINNLILKTGDELLASIPYVNAIFFEQNSSIISEEYLKTKLNEQSEFVGDIIKNNYSILYKIQKILANNPKAKIQLDAYTSGIENEPEGLELARKRVENVKSQLINLGINQNRISINYQISPKYKSNQDFSYGISENQRVDLNLIDAQYQIFVNFNKFKEINFDASFDLSIKNIDSNLVYLSNNFNNNTVNNLKSGNYNLPFKYRINNSDTSFNFKLNLFSDNLSDSASTLLHLEKIQNQNNLLELNNFSATLRFNYNSYELSEDNKQLIKQLINKLPDNSLIEILGSSDKLGTEERNNFLTLERAKITENYINSLSGNKFKITTGSNPDKFDENTPIGRFLNRSIRIKVRPIK